MEIRKSKIIAIEKYLKPRLLDNICSKVDKYAIERTDLSVLVFGMSLAEDHGIVSDKIEVFFMYKEKMYRAIVVYELAEDSFDDNKLVIECCRSVKFSLVENYAIVDKKRVVFTLDIDCSNNTLREIEDFLKSKCDIVSKEMVFNEI